MPAEVAESPSWRSATSAPGTLSAGFLILAFMVAVLPDCGVRGVHPRRRRSRLLRYVPATRAVHLLRQARQRGCDTRPPERLVPPDASAVAYRVAELRARARPARTPRGWGPSSS